MNDICINLNFIFISAPPMNRRTWEAPQRGDRLGSCTKTLSDKYIVAEVQT